MKAVVQNSCLVLVSLCIGYSLAEALYRVHHYQKLTKTRYLYHTVREPIYQFDPLLGFRYRSNLNVPLSHHDNDHTLLRTHRIRTNSAGHISPEEDSMIKPKGEFRIALLGDSFTASLYNDLPWPWILQNKLNADVVLKEKLKIKSFKTINFGRDSAGFPMFWQVYQNEVRNYRPDLIVTTFIDDDLFRHLIWKHTTAVRDAPLPYEITQVCRVPKPTDNDPNCTWDTILSLPTKYHHDRDALELLHKTIFTRRAKSLPFFALKPYLLAQLIGWEPLSKELSLKKNFMLHGQETSVASVAILRQLQKENPNHFAIFLPKVDQIDTNSVNPLVTRLLLDHEFNIIDSTPAFTSIPKEQLVTLFNLPHDWHFSNSGADYFASYVEKLIHHQLMTDDARPKPLS